MPEKGHQIAELNPLHFSQELKAFPKRVLRFRSQCFQAKSKRNGPTNNIFNNRRTGKRQSQNPKHCSSSESLKADEKL